MSTLEKKLYQLIISRIDGEKLTSDTYQEQALTLVQKGIGGFILFGGRKEMVKSFTDMVQTVAETPLFIASDIERGAGQQIAGAARFPCQMAAAAAVDRNSAEDIDMLKNALRAVAEEAIGIGINMPLIPVLDVNRNPDNPIICTRAFSDDPEAVAWFGRLYIRVLEDAGLISCAKHFPGHGDTDIDSHISLPVISKSMKELTAADIFPFREAIKEKVSSIMVGHLAIPAIDTLPASLSEKVITGLLRKELGYEGLILTDALNMHALNKFGNVPSACMNAGMDILLHPADADTVVNELEQAIASGEVKEATIDTAVGRILKFKTGISSIRNAAADTGQQEPSGLLYDRSITLVKGVPGLFPLADLGDASFIYHCDRDDFDVSPLAEVSSGALLKLKHADLNALKGIAVIALFTNAAAWRGSTGIDDEAVAAVRHIMKKARAAVIVSFGSPYVLRHFSEADALVAAYGSDRPAQLSVIKCLRGENQFRGRLPVRL